MNLYIETLGCAMNERDSEHIISELAKDGYEECSDPRLADLILINTCSVREKPERKLFSEIGAFAKIKKPTCKIGITGCTASHMGEEIIKRSKHVNFVLGARNISKIRSIINRDKAVEIDLNYDDSTYVFDTRITGIKALMNISIGCDKKCSYCIVPHTRGKEISIPFELLLREAIKLGQSGVKEILLLGQNVNNYGVRFSVPHEKINFSKLLFELEKVEGIERIRFTSPHPLHMDDEFLEEFARNTKVCKNIHIPLQSGSSKILKAMRRGYTKEWYLKIIQKLRNLVSDVSISTDIIVGFPGETEEDFLETMDVLEKVQFDTIYSFIYSPRPHTEAANFTQDFIPSEIAKDRLMRLQSRHREIITKNAQKEISKKYQILIENNRNDDFVFSEGRSFNGKLVKINELIDIGKFVDIEITENVGGALLGKTIATGV